jgi:invasion protein IalB
MANESKPNRAGLWLAAILGLGLAAAPAPLAAQTEAPQSGAEIETQKFEDWTLRCRPALATQLRTCHISLQAFAQDSGKQVLQFRVGRFGPEKVLGAVIFVPVGVRLPPGLRIQIDERPPRVFAFEICDSATCQARVVLEGELLDQLKAGLTGQVKFQNAAGQMRSVPVSLKGFTAALRALP